MSKYKSVKINKGKTGWGKFLVVTPTDQKNKVISVTGGGIHEVAERVAELSGGIAVDGFKNPVDNNEVFLAVVDCGGTLRTGLFPKQGIPTINILDGGPSGPMADYCNESNYISGSKASDVELIDTPEEVGAPVEKIAQARAAAEETASQGVS